MRSLLIFLLPFFLLGCGTSFRECVYLEPEHRYDSIEIHKSIVSQHAQRINYKRAGKSLAIIELSEPVMVAMAEQEEPWGYFQFPSIGLSSHGILQVSWQMSEDSQYSYGKLSLRENKPMISKDGGKTWQPQDNSYQFRMRGYQVEMSSGLKLQVSTPSVKDVKSYNSFPRSVGESGSSSFYREDQLPEELRGVYFNYEGKNGSTRIHALLNDPGLLRGATDGQMPIVWWGDIKEMADHSLIAGIYPTRYLNKNGVVSESGVSFYHSKDSGKSWDILSRIPYNEDGITEIKGDRRFDEPTFEILSDSTLICVLRTGSASPLCKTFSYDKGLTWTKPVPFTPNGVKPSLLMLKNGVLVLTSGRPGVQVRFSFDGGRVWTDAIDMIPYSQEGGPFAVSCGYVAIIDADYDSFYIAYSDFTTKNDKGDKRKSIWIRKIRVNK